MALMARISQANIVQATKKHTATVFFFHGSGKIFFSNYVIVSTSKNIIKLSKNMAI